MKKQPTSLSIAEHYHELTKYSPESLSSSAPDPLQRPSLFKEYLSERAVDLKPFLKGVPAKESEPDGSRSLLRSISRILYHTGGITDIVEGRGGTIYFRAAPSAGALYPTEIYFATRGIGGLLDGIHSYSVREHALVPLWEGDFGKELENFCFQHPAAVGAKMFIILTSVFRRSAWRYRERAYRRILLDAGHVLGNATAYAPAEGFDVVGIAGFHDAAVNDLLFLESEDEVALVIAPVVPRKDLDARKGPCSLPPASPRTSPPSGGPEKGIMLLLHEGSAITRSGQRPPHRPLEAILSAAGGRTAQVGEPVPLGLPPAGSIDSLAPSIGPVIRRRRSARAFGRRPLGRVQLAGILRSAYAPVRPYLAAEEMSLRDCRLNDPAMISTYIAAIRVEGLRPGVYALDVESSRLLPRKEGSFQTELWNLCLGQELGRDAAAAVIHVADLPASVDRYGDRAYRYLHIDAGHLGERMNLAAVSRDVAVSGIGGFFDNEVNALLELPERISTLYITLLGSPASDAEK